MSWTGARAEGYRTWSPQRVVAAKRGGIEFNRRQFHRLWLVLSFAICRGIGQSLASFVRERPVNVDRDGTVAMLQCHKCGCSRASERIEHQRVSVA